jgi:hypothetical protein
MCKKLVFIFIILTVVFLIVKQSNYSKIEQFCNCGTTIPNTIPNTDIPENKEGFCSDGCIENFQGGFSKNYLNENFCRSSGSHINGENPNFCPGECNGKRYSTKYLYNLSCDVNTPTINSLKEPYFITTRYN